MSFLWLPDPLRPRRLLAETLCRSIRNARRVVDVCRVPEAGLDEVRRLPSEYTGTDESLKSLRERYRITPTVRRCLRRGPLVGYCLGRERTADRVELVGIAVETSYQHRGLETELLAGFEERVRSLGFERITLGSAGGYVDEFYADNGY